MDWESVFNIIGPIALRANKFEKWGEHEKQLWAQLISADVETMAELTLNYIGTCTPNAHLVKSIGLKITTLLEIPPPPSRTEMKEEAIRPIVTELAEYRHSVREIARLSKDKILFQLYDDIRIELQLLGVHIEDTKSGPRVKIYSE